MTPRIAGTLRRSHAYEYILVCLLLLHLQCIPTAAQQRQQPNQKQDLNKPNLVIIYTDEHNLRTIGAYHDILPKDQALVWGNGVKLDTPHLDALANQGAIYSNFYTVAPLCTPSRASFMTGLYPKATGAWNNHGIMKQSVVTWAETLNKNRNYATGYIGKWHLNGDVKPGFDMKGRGFGFMERKYQYNRGHWKFFEKKDKTVIPYEWKEGAVKFKHSMKEHYATDFLVDRGVEFIEKHAERRKPFAVMISIPDPHSPNIVRPPYDTMYDHFNFEVTKTARAALNKSPALPPWSVIDFKLEDSDKMIRDLERDEERQRRFRSIFSMVKLIDDGVGKIMQTLKRTGVADNTIVVFTSDHGDLMGEHAKHNKGRPYKTSAGVPYIISYPNKIKKGKVIHTAYSSVDFAPTLLSLMNVKNTDLQFDGLDGSAELLSNTKVSNNEKQIRFVSDSTNAKWAAAVTGSHMLVVSSAGPPWLFDLQEDPDEMYNVFETGNHTLVSNEMITEMYDAMHEYELPIKDQEFLFMSKPACFDSYDQLPAMKDVLCSDLLNSKFSIGCQFRHIYEKCSVTCGVCCEDSSGKIWLNGEMKGCNSLRSECGIRRVQKFCPRTCNTCYQEDFNHDEFLYYHFDDDEGDDNFLEP